MITLNRMFGCTRILTLNWNTGEQCESVVGGQRLMSDGLVCSTLLWVGKNLESCMKTIESLFPFMSVCIFRPAELGLRTFMWQLRNIQLAVLCSRLKIVIQMKVCWLKYCAVWWMFKTWRNCDWFVERLSTIWDLPWWLSQWNHWAMVYTVCVALNSHCVLMCR